MGMDIKKIIKEEVNDFDWTENSNPRDLVFEIINLFGEGMNHDGWVYEIVDDYLLYKRPETVHPETNLPVELKIELPLDDSGKLTGKFPMWYKDTKGEWKHAKSQPHGEQTVLSTGDVEYYMNNKNKSYEEATKEVLNGLVMLFYNNWYSQYEPLNDY